VSLNTNKPTVLEANPCRHSLCAKADFHNFWLYKSTLRLPLCRWSGWGWCSGEWWSDRNGCRCRHQSTSSGCQFCARVLHPARLPVAVHLGSVLLCI